MGLYLCIISLHTIHLAWSCQFFGWPIDGIYWPRLIWSRCSACCNWTIRAWGSSRTPLMHPFVFWFFVLPKGIQHGKPYVSNVSSKPHLLEFDPCFLNVFFSDSSWKTGSAASETPAVHRRSANEIQTWHKRNSKGSDHTTGIREIWKPSRTAQPIHFSWQDERLIWFSWDINSLAPQTWQQPNFCQTSWVAMAIDGNSVASVLARGSFIGSFGYCNPASNSSTEIFSSQTANGHKPCNFINDPPNAEGICGFLLSRFPLLPWLRCW